MDIPIPIPLTAVQTWIQNLYTENQNLKIEVNTLKAENDSLRQENESLKNSGNENTNNSSVTLPALSTAQSYTNNAGINGTENVARKLIQMYRTLTPRRKRPRIESIDGDDDDDDRTFENQNQNDDEDFDTNAPQMCPLDQNQNQNQTTNPNEETIHENEDEEELDGIPIPESDREKLEIKQELIDGARRDFEETEVFSSLGLEEQRMSTNNENQNVVRGTEDELAVAPTADDNVRPSISTSTLKTSTPGPPGSDQGHNNSSVSQRKDKAKPTGNKVTRPNKNKKNEKLYYKEITEACVGSDETRRTKALQSLTNDPSLFEILPKLCTFIAEGVRVNLVQFNFTRLICLMRMVKALLENQTLSLEKYLDELIPSVLKCIVSEQLCLRPETENHWALRDFASKLIGQICRNYTGSTNNIQTRFSSTLSQKKVPFSSVYGAIAGLGEMGPDVVKSLIVPKIKVIGKSLALIMNGVGHTQADKTSALRIKKLLTKVMCGVLKTCRPVSDTDEDCKNENEFGYLGEFLRAASSCCSNESEGSKTICNGHNCPACQTPSSPSPTALPMTV